MKRAFLVLTLIVAPIGHAAEPLGRLFHTPDERSRLDHARTLPPAQAKPAPVPTVAKPVLVKPRPEPKIITVNGIIQRSDGQSTVWINGQPFAEHETQGQSAKHLDVLSVTVQSPTSGRRVQLQVGQTLNSESGQILETYAKQVK